MLHDSHAPCIIRFKRNFSDKKVIRCPLSSLPLPLSLRFLTPLSLVIKTPRRDLSRHARVRAKLVAPFGTSLVKASRVTDESRICQRYGKDACFVLSGFIRPVR